MSDLEQIIADSVNDSITGTDDTPEVVADTPSEPVEASTSDSEAPEVSTPEAEVEVPSPAAQAAPEAAPAEPQDEFAKLVGMPQVGVGGRENRIPYSRVKKITEKAVKDAESKVYESVLGRKLNEGENPAEAIKAITGQLPELQTKVTDYEARLETVGRFEEVMETDPEKFLGMLEKLPAYKDFFAFVNNAVAQAEGRQAPAAQNAPAITPDANMPEPDEELPDGSKVYSLEGLKGLLAWNANQTENRVIGKYEAKLKELEDRYGPMRNEWETYNKTQAVMPTIRKQIEEAKTWPLFTESEGEILEVLKKDKQISLEGAYRQVVFPKLVADRNKTRQELIREVQQAPVSTSVPARAATKPAPAGGDGPRSIEDIIREQVESLKK